ncbi:hypothetical protein BU15DRAFT_59465 [Melanogaster broomeanus]|nr:hypothetical protein BU15DRAFT_59465 [Melanogaster broomeanus]
MTVPSLKPPEPQQHDSHSPVDLPYHMSSSGHLIPYSPSPPRRSGGERFSQNFGSQTSLHEEPSPIDHESPRPRLHSILRHTTSTSSIHADEGNHRQSPDTTTHVSHPHDPHHRTVAFASSSSLQTFSGSPVSRPTSLFGPHSHNGGTPFEPPRSQTPRSTRSLSQKSVSHRSTRSRNSGVSIGRASYREYLGPPRARAPAPSAIEGSAVMTGSCPTIGRAAPDGSSAPPGHLFAPPNINDPGQPGEPIVGYGRFRFEPMSTRGVHRDSLPDGWTAHRHPEGALYFMHSDSKTFTEVNICNEEIYGDIEYFRNSLFKDLQVEIHNRNLSGSLSIGEVQLVIEPQESLLVAKLERRRDLSRLQRCLLSFTQRTWYPITLLVRGNGRRRHWDLFPNLCTITEDLKNEVVDMILHATCDRLTSNRSSCSLTVEELKNYLSLIDKTSYNDYFINFHGEECARLSFDQTVHGWRYHPSLLMTVCAPLLFMAPVTSVRSLHRIFVDDKTSTEKWNMFVNKLNSQLQDTNLLATVLLNANVGFLAIQSVDDGGGTSLRQLASYMSLVASLASIVLGLAFVEHNRTGDTLQHKRHGLEIPAIIYTLPYAFLMWGMVFILRSVCVRVVWSTRRHIIGFRGGFMLFVAFLLAWCIWTSREKTEYWWFEADPEQFELYHRVENNGAPWTSKLGLLRRLVPPSWTRNRTCLELTTENHAMRGAPNTQDVPSTPDEDSPASSRLSSIVVTQKPGHLKVPST